APRGHRPEDRQAHPQVDEEGRQEGDREEDDGEEGDRQEDGQEGHRQEDHEEGVTPMGRERSDFVVVANRLPVAPVDDASAPGDVRWEASPGGLVTALTPVLLRNNGAWVGW